MKKPFLKTLSLVLTLALIINMLPLHVFASDEEDSVSNPFVDVAEEPTPAEIVGEETRLRSEVEKHFRLSDGSYIAVSYGMPVHYQDTAGSWHDIDNSLTLSTDQTAYQSANAEVDSAFSADLSAGNLVSTGYGNVAVTMGLLDTAQALALTQQDGAMASEEDTTGLVFDRNCEAILVSDISTFVQLDDVPGWTAEELIPEDLASTVLYEDIYPNVDIRYTAYSYNIKEEIIVKAAQSAYRYDFFLSVDGATAALNQDGSISISNEEGDLVYFIPAPYMRDAAGDSSRAVSYTLTSVTDGMVLTVEADATWINDENRAFPVTIDPSLEASVKTWTTDENADIYGTYVEEGDPTNCHYSAYEMYIGHSIRYKEHRGYLHVNNLPTVPAGHHVTSASMNLYMIDYSYVGCTEFNIGLYPVSAELETGTDYYSLLRYMTWNNQLAYDTNNMIDYTAVGLDDVYSYCSWDMTELVKKWYIEGTENRTVALARLPGAQEYGSTYCGFPMFNVYSGSAPAMLVVSYRCNIGLEPYYTYSSLSAGNAGVAYIADATGQLKASREVASYASVINPFSLNIVYNSDYFSANNTADYQPTEQLGLDMRIGSGWTLDIIQKMEAVTIGNTPYLKYTDGDGTAHYFQQNSRMDEATTDDPKSYYYDEDGLGLKIFVESNGSYTMSDDQDNKWFFTSIGSYGYFLTKSQDNNGNQILVTYDSGKLTKISQKNNGASEITVATLTYTGDYVTKIADNSGAYCGISYDAATGTKLVQMTRNTYPCGQYEYDGYRLKTMTDAQRGYSLRFSYTNSKVSHYDEYSGGQTGVQCDISYPSYTRTVYLDYGNDRTKGTADDIVTHYLFDYAGRTANAYTTNKDGSTILGASNAVHSANSDVSKTNNRTIRTASIGVAAQSLLPRGNFENSGATWTYTNSDDTSTKPHTGATSVEAVLSASTATASVTRATRSLTAGKCYTFSAYVNTSEVTSISGTGVYLKVTDSSGNSYVGESLNYKTSVSIDGGWERISVTFTAQTTGNHTVGIYGTGMIGTFFADDAQVELGEAPSKFNLLENGNMNINNYGWTMGSNASYVSSMGVNTIDASERALKIIGSPSDTAANATQAVSINLPSTSTFVLSGWACANAVPDNMNTAEDTAQDLNKQFGLRAIITYSDNTKEYHYIPFNPDLTDWQFTSMTVVPKASDKTISTITVVCAYEGNANIAYFDNISLVQEVAQTLKYDKNGNVVSVASTGTSEATSAFDEGNLIQSVTGGGGTYNYAYSDSANKHRPTAISDDQITQTLTYNSQGGVTGTTMFATPEADKKEGVDTITETASGIYLQTSTTYSSDGNQQISTSDSSGNNSTSVYSNASHKTHGIPSTVTDAKGTEMTYATDVFGRYRNITVDNGAGLKYVYGKTRLHQIVRQENGSTDLAYQFYYDAFDNMTALKVGKTIESNNLTAGMTLAIYEYGSNNGLLEKQIYGNNDYITFTYDDLGRTKTATYSDGRVLTYSYTGDGQLYSTHDSETGYTYLYVYDSLGRLVSSQIKSASGTILRTEQIYNTNNQLTSQNWQMGDTTYTEQYTYLEDGSIATMVSPAGQTLTFNYDALRRLQKIEAGSLYAKEYAYKTISGDRTSTLISGLTYSGFTNAPVFGYDYDELGNIISYTENGTTYSYTYDELNQLLSATGNGKNYSYSYDRGGNILTSSDGTTTHTYTYGNAEWADLLTAYDGQTISYDGSGNPTSYYNGTRWSFTWEEGSLLTYAAANGKGYSYTYDSNGVRTSKVVNGVTHNYIYASGRILQETYGDVTLDFLYDNDGSPFALIYKNGTAAAQTYYYITNIQGDVLYLLDSAENVVASYTYDPWGKVLSAEGDMAEVNPLRYRGYYLDSETDLYYLLNRYYDPAISRFINADTVVAEVAGPVLGTNLFAYCFNNPINLQDNNGQWPSWAKKLAAAVAVVAVVATVAAVVVATGGAGAGVVCALTGAAKGAAIGLVSGAVEGAIGGAISHRINTGSWEGAGEAALNGMADGALNGAITGAIVGAVASPNCFVAGTPVQTEDGVQTIETIQAGDKVWAWDEETDTVALKEVVETYVNETTELIHVFVDGEEIVTTPAHPFYSPVKGWTDAVHLRAGDILVLLNGEYVVVERVQHEILEAPIAVYNFQVEGYHTYYVSDVGVLVHNSCNHGKEWGHEKRSHWREQGQKYKNNVHNQPSDNGLYEVSQRNVDRMLKGRAPIGTDNKSVVLHHTKGIANDFYDYVEMLGSVHTSKFKELHSFLFKK